MKKLSITLLAQAVAALGNASQPFIYSTEKEMKELLDLGLVDKNETVNDGKGNIAFRANDAGKAEHAKLTSGGGSETATATASKPSFVIKSGVALPKIARPGGNGQGSKYPIEELQPGQSFFIPAPADMKSPSKSFGSLVAAANKKHKTNDDNYRRFTTRSVMGDDWDQPGVKGIAIYRLPAEDEAKAKAKDFAPAANA